MRAFRTTVVIGLTAMACLGIATATVAIGEDEDPEVVYCQSLVELTASIEGLRAVDATSTVDEFESAVERVEEAATSTEESARAMLEAQVEDLETAIDGLRDYRDSLEGDETMEAVVQGAGDAVAAVGVAHADVGTIPNCAVVAGEQQAEEEAED
jgi:hypothetical protein